MGLVANNAREEFAVIARNLEPSLLSHAIRLCAGDTDWAKDVTQDALIRGYSSYLDGGFGKDSNPKAWLIRILTNVFINQYNRKKKWESGLDIEKLDNETVVAVTSTGSPEDSMLEQAFDEPLQRALSALPEEQRICVLLIDVEGYEYAETAKLIGVPVGTVRSRLARARIKLYSLLLPYAQDRRLV
jgi:RNA polymerase sigma-70 factor (ECF subfamily)